MIKIEDIIFWILIIITIGTALWLLFGSPTEMQAIIAIALFVASSEIIIWKKIFSIDKNITIGFMKIKHDLDNKFKDLNNKK